MYKKLARHGNSSALVLDKPILELLNITEHTQLKITTDGTSLIITPVSHAVSEQNTTQQADSADSVEPFREFIKRAQMQNIALTPGVIKEFIQNPTIGNQKQVVEYVRKMQELFKDPEFSEIRKKINDAYAPSLDEYMQTLIQEFKEVDLKQFPEHVQKWCLQEAQTDEHIIERMNSQEYRDAMEQVQTVLQAKFIKLFEEYNATHKDLRHQMHENFAQARQELEQNNSQK